MKFKLLLLALVSAALVATNAASAFVTNPGPGTWRSLTTCLNGGTITLTSGQYLRIGWGTITETQSYNFLDAQSGTVSITGTNGSQSWTWGVGDTTNWTVPALVSAPGNQLNGGKPIWFTGAFLQVTLPPGSYTISANLAINKTVQDGGGSVKQGSWFTTSACSLVVQ